MQNIISWFEIPAVNFERAVNFYQTLLSIEIVQQEVLDTRMGFFPSNENIVSGAVVQGDDYSPAFDGVLVYLNGGQDLQTIMDKVENAKGKILVPKTLISEEMGYFGIFIDTEGNKMAVHSKN